MNIGPDVDFEQETPRNGVASTERGRPAGAKRRFPQPRPMASRERGSNAKPGFAVDMTSLLLPAIKRWPWLIIGAAVGTALGLFLALSLFKQSYSATAKLERYVPPLATDAYNPQPLTVPTLVHIIMSPDFFLRVGRKLNPPTTGGAVASRLTTIPERNTEILSVRAAGNTPEEAVKLANLYTEEVVAYTKDIQLKDAEQAERYTDQHLRELENDIALARKDIPPLPPGALARLTDITAAVPSSGPDRFSQKIQIAEDELSVLLSRYTDEWPAVKQKRAEINALQLSAAAARRLESEEVKGTDIEKTGVSLEEREIAHFRLRQLESDRARLMHRKHAISLIKSEPPGSFAVEMPAAIDNVEAHRSWPKIALMTIFFGMLGLALAGSEMLFREFLDTRLKTDLDVARVTGLPIIATLGDLRKMSLSARENWAFRTWISLQDRLAFSPNHGLICGITSSRAGDGRTTWVNLLAGAARQCGFRVLTIATKPTAVPVDGIPAETVANGSAPQSAVPASALLSPPTKNGTEFAGESHFTAMTASALFTPAEVTEKLSGPDSDPVVHIPLPGWTWNLERRKQWQSALNVWRKIDNVVILVELPPASVHESVLLAANLPNILWLSEAGKSEATETRQQLETLRHARCNLVGAVVNRSPAPTKHGRFSRWVGCLAPFVVALSLASNTLMAGEDSRPPAMAPEPARATSAATFTMIGPEHRAPWQQRLTLGPGDIVTISLFGEPGLVREEVPIGPDGKIGYLEAQGVQAAGLTVDELRDRLNTELGRFRREPQVYVLPVAYRSKKYYVLGKVAERGAFPLDRPITLIEAIARARGVEVGIATADNSLVELADMSRAFVSRRGQHLQVDFHKLFHEGDLSQNIALEPDDYIYLPSADLKEVYVLGSVQQPGAFLYTADVGALSAIAARGGFTMRAWKNRVLVIRGSLSHPETFVIEATDVLSARAADIRLQPRDIVFVSDRPWARAQELLDTAASAFATAATVTWTGIHVNGLNQ